MTFSIFDDQAVFMSACGQTVGVFNDKQADLYCDLIAEEVDELYKAASDGDGPEVLDALIDILVVTVGALHSLGVNPQRCWDIVHKTNLAKIDSDTGLVRKREDGKILKPVDWQSPGPELTIEWLGRNE